jgi:hypothetical protein
VSSSAGRPAPTRIGAPGTAWEAVHLPGSEPAIRRAVLHREGRGGRSVLAVEFPAGWRRPAAGHFLVDEEFLVLRGRLEISGVEVRAGEVAVVPAGALRADSAAGPEGCLAVAWFGGVPGWLPGPAPDPVGPITRRRVEGVLLLEGGAARPHPGREVTGPADVVTTEGAWTEVPAGGTLPLPDRDALVRPRTAPRPSSHASG